MAHESKNRILVLNDFYFIKFIVKAEDMIMDVKTRPLFYTLPMTYTTIQTTSLLTITLCSEYFLCEYTIFTIALILNEIVSHSKQINSTKQPMVKHEYDRILASRAPYFSTMSSYCRYTDFRTSTTYIKT